MAAVIACRYCRRGGFQWVMSAGWRLADVVTGQVHSCEEAKAYFAAKRAGEARPRVAPVPREACRPTLAPIDVGLDALRTSGAEFQFAGT